MCCFVRTTNQKKFNQLFDIWKNTKKQHKSSEYLLKVITLHLHRKDRLAKETSTLFPSFFENMKVVNAAKNQSVIVNDFPNQTLKAGPEPFF